VISETIRIQDGPTLNEVKVDFYPSESGSGQLVIGVHGHQLAIVRAEVSPNEIQIVVEERWG
jgi:hypothetical protein